MSNNINLRKGLNVPLAGAAVRTVRKTILPDVVAIRPSDFRNLTPKLLVKEGDKVKMGDLLLEMDLDKIAAAAHPAVVITVVTNTDDFKDVEVVASGAVEPGADLIKISK